MIGKLGYTIIEDQFSRIRDGDRFWYENRLPRRLVRLLKRTKLRDIILRNTDVENIQRYVMLYEER